MQRTQLTPQEAWRSVHETVAQSYSSLYLAGTAYILLLWGALVSVYFFALFAMGELAPGFEASYPWFRGPLWGIIGTAGMIGSALIGHREGERNADSATARSAGLKVFAYWITVVAAAFLISGTAGLWSSEGAEKIPHVTIGIIALGYVLFGILYLPALVFVGIGMAAAFTYPTTWREISRRWVRGRACWPSRCSGRHGSTGAGGRDPRGYCPRRDHPSARPPPGDDDAGGATRGRAAGLRIHPKDSGPHRRQPDDAPAQAGGRGPARDHQGVRRIEATNLGGGHPGGAQSIRGIPR